MMKRPVRGLATVLAYVGLAGSLVFGLAVVTVGAAGHAPVGTYTVDMLAAHLEARLTTPG